MTSSSAPADTYTAFEAWVTSTKPWWVTDLSRYDGERYRHEETWKAFEAFAAGRGSVVAPPAPAPQPEPAAVPAGPDAGTALWARDGIANFIADNWPDRKHTLAEIEAGIRAIEITPARPSPSVAQPAPAGVVEALAKIEAIVDLPREPSWAYRNTITNNRNAIREQVAAARAALSTPVQAAHLTEAARDVLAERRRQVEAEGWTPEHDDQHGDGSLALAAACYAAADPDGRAEAPPLWPWGPEWWKSGDERRNLVKAGALILAEIERLDRAAHGITGDTNAC